MPNDQSWEKEKQRARARDGVLKKCADLEPCELSFDSFVE